MKREKLKVENLYIQKFFSNTLNSMMIYLLYSYLSSVVGEEEQDDNYGTKNIYAQGDPIFLYSIHIIIVAASMWNGLQKRKILEKLDYFHVLLSIKPEMK